MYLTVNATVQYANSSENCLFAFQNTYLITIHFVYSYTMNVTTLSHINPYFLVQFNTKCVIRN